MDMLDNRPSSPKEDGDGDEFSPEGPAEGEAESDDDDSVNQVDHADSIKNEANDSSTAEDGGNEDMFVDCPDEMETLVTLQSFEDNSDVQDTQFEESGNAIKVENLIAEIEQLRDMLAEKDKFAQEYEDEKAAFTREITRLEYDRLELHSTVRMKDQHIEFLNTKFSEYDSFLSETTHLRGCLAEIIPNLDVKDETEIIIIARNKLLELKRNEEYLYQNLRHLDGENRKLVEHVDKQKVMIENANAEIGRLNALLEQEKTRCTNTKEKLNLAVTKGKSLVQHRDSLKQLLSEKTSELEKCLIELQEKSTALEAAEKYKDLVAISENLAASLLESLADKDMILQQCGEIFENIKTLVYIREHELRLHELMVGEDIIDKMKVERLLNELETVTRERNALKAEKVVLQENLEVLEGKSSLFREKLSMAVKKGKGLVQERENLKGALDEKNAEIDKLRTELKSVEDALLLAENNILKLINEKEAALQRSVIVEEELQRLKDELSVCSSKLVGGENTIQSLEEALVNAENKMANLLEDKENVEQEILALNSKLDMCTQELAGIHGKTEVQSVELSGYLNRLMLLLRDETLLSLQQQCFEKKLESLNDMDLLLKEIEDCFLQVNSDVPQNSRVVEDHTSISNIRPSIVDNIHTMEVANGEVNAADGESILLHIEKMVEGLCLKDKILADKFEYISAVTNESYATLYKKLYSTKDRMIHMVEFINSLKQKVNEFEMDKQRMENAIVSVERNMQKELEETKETCDGLIKERDMYKERIVELETDKKARESMLDEMRLENEDYREKVDKLEEKEAELSSLYATTLTKVPELENCVVQLQEKLTAPEAAEKYKDLLVTSENMAASLRESLAEKDMILWKCGEMLSESNVMEEFQSTDFVERLKSIVEERKKLKAMSVEYHGLEDSLSLFDFPETVISSGLDTRIRWLLDSFYQSKEEALKLRREIAETKDAASSEIDRLISSLSAETQEKSNLQAQLERLQHEILEAKEEINCLKSSQIGVEIFENVKTVLYIRDQELRLYELIVGEDILDRTKVDHLLNECNTLKAEKAVFKENLEVLGRKSSLLREKLSMAVKKGKGLAQERENLKGALDEKNAEIDKLRTELQQKVLAMDESHDKICILSSDMERKLLESEMKTKSIDDVLSDAKESISLLLEEKRELEVAKKHVEHELKAAKDEAYSRDLKFEEVSANIRSVEDALLLAENNISKLMNEKDVALQRSALAEDTIRSLEEALVNAKNKMANLEDEKRNAEGEIFALNSQLDLCTQELAGTHCKTEIQSLELSGHLNRLMLLLKDETLLSLQQQCFEKKLGSLKDIDLVLKEMEGCFLEVQSDVPQNSSISNIRPAIIDNVHPMEVANGEVNLADGESILLHIDKMVEGFHLRDKILADKFEYILAAMMEIYATLYKRLYLTKDRMIRMHEFINSLKQKVTEFEIDRQWMENTIASVERNMQKKLEETKETCERVVEERDMYKERTVELETDKKTREIMLDEMRLKVEDYRAKVDKLEEKEAELSSTLSKAQESESSLLSASKTKILFDKIKEIEVPEHAFAIGGEENGTVDVRKLFYIIDTFNKSQQMLSSLMREKEELQSSLDKQVVEIENLKVKIEEQIKNEEDLERMKNELLELDLGLQNILKKLGADELINDHKWAGSIFLVPMLDKLVTTMAVESENLKLKTNELSGMLSGSQMLVNDLSNEVKLLQDHTQARNPPSENVEEMKSEISQVQDMGLLDKSNSISPVPSAAHVRTMRTSPSDNVVVDINSEFERLVNNEEADEDKGHVFKSLSTSGLIPVHGRTVADRIDGIWVSGGRALMGRPRARLGVIAYCLFLHIWLLGTIL